MRSHPSPLRTKISLVASFVITVALTVGVPSVAHADSINQLASWGFGASGRLGNGATTSSPVPVNVTTSGVLDGKSIAQVSAGSGSTCALDTAGLAYCWGSNSNGELGNASTTSSSVPVAVSMPAGVTFTSISVGDDHACAVSTLGAGYCWGYGGHGELGGGYIPPSPFYETTPRPVSMPSGKSFRTISAGNRYTCAVTIDNLGYCWGTNGNGQLGVGPLPSSTDVPIAVTGGLLFSSIQAGNITTCGLRTTNSAYCWGWGFNGQRGDNSTTSNQFSPVAVNTADALPDTYSQLSSGSQSSSFCGVTASGEAWCWGINSSGQLGNGSTTQSIVPSQVTPVTARTFSAVATGANFACALTNVGEVYCWGGNSEGQLGDNSLTDRPTPVPVVSSEVLQNSQMTMLSAGEGATFVIATTVPATPTSVGATAGVESAAVSWTAPVRTGGTAITEYTVTSTPGSRTCTTAGTSCTVSGLTAGTSYTFTVVATNARGTSLASSATSSVTPTANSGGGGGGGGGDTPANNTPTATPVAAETNTAPAQMMQTSVISADKLATGDIKELSLTEIRSLPASAFSSVSRATMSLFTQEQVSVLTKSQLRAITPFALKGLTPAAVKGLTAKQLAELTAKQKAAFTKEQRAAMTDKQRKALQPKKRRT